MQAAGRAPSEMDAPAGPACCLMFFWGEGREVAGSIWQALLSPLLPEPHCLKGQRGPGLERRKPFRKLT